MLTNSAHCGDGGLSAKVGPTPAFRPPASHGLLRNEGGRVLVACSFLEVSELSMAEPVARVMLERWEEGLWAASRVLVPWGAREASVLAKAT